MPRHFISDLDGTLLQNNHELDRETITAIRNLHDCGGTFSIATGRHNFDVMDLSKRIDRPIGMISCNGGMVIDPNNKIIGVTYIPIDTSISIINYPLPKDIHLNAYTIKSWYINETNNNLENYSPQSGFKYKIINKKFLKRKRIIKFFLLGDRLSLLKLHDELQVKYFGKLDFSFSLPWCMEIMPVGVNKASAVSLLCNHLGFTPKQTMAFGDGENDIEMLKYVGFPKVMLNASTSVKKAVPHAEVIGHAHSLGVAEYINKLISS
ncbi:HAD family hydrolase [Vibrio sp. S4M6]|uniref:HAD family hydrolase n=1 Tax=Vibrio sinus TaxID=2946865 RepID=UPI00202A1A93|nr:HAD family hydrolase [Vibrio sinus]MCL9781624.1 HAD family hydrolase [Vibrio sinus]